MEELGNIEMRKKLILGVVLVLKVISMREGYFSPSLL